MAPKKDVNVSANPLPISFSQFSKDPIKGTMFLVIIGITVLYVDIRGNFNNQINSQDVTAKKEDNKIAEDKEFEQFMNDFNQTLTKNKAVQVKADEAKEAIVTSTVSKFAEIKQEVNTLKTELNEVKQTLDSVSNDTAISFKLLPISHHKKD